MKMQEKSNSSKLRIMVILGIIAIVLAIPLIAMQFTKEVKWTLTDFATAAVMLMVTGLAIELVIRNLTAGIWKTIVLVIILLALFLVWAELAVGVFGTPFAGN